MHIVCMHHRVNCGKFLVSAIKIWFDCEDKWDNYDNYNKNILNYNFTTTI